MTPFMAPKLIALIVGVGLVFGGGFAAGKLYQGHADQGRIDKITEARDAAKSELAQAKLDWAEAQAKSAAATALALKASQEKAAKAEADAQAQITANNARWQTQLKKVKNDADAALAKVLRPVDSSDPITDGMWVDAHDCRSSEISRDGLPPARYGTADDPLRCRLHPQVAARLIESATEANQVVQDLNTCIANLKVLSPASFPAPEPGGPK